MPQVIKCQRGVLGLVVPLVALRRSSYHAIVSSGAGHRDRGTRARLGPRHTRDLVFISLAVGVVHFGAGIGMNELGKSLMRVGERLRLGGRM